MERLPKRIDTNLNPSLDHFCLTFYFNRIKRSEFGDSEMTTFDLRILCMRNSWKSTS